MRSAKRRRTSSCKAGATSSWRRTHSEWGSIARTSGSWCTSTCRAASRRITRKRDAPDARGTQLKPDAAKLREKERRDRAKLKLMIEFAYARTCRQQAILRYFGEEDPSRCGNCDICLEIAGPARAPTTDEALIVRKALSGVARMSGRGSEGWEPRFGRGRIVQTLVGSRSREIIQARLDQLSTYGLLQSEGVAYLNQLLRALQDAGMLVYSGGQ